MLTTGGVDGEYETEFTTLTLLIYTHFDWLRRHSIPCLFSSPVTHIVTTLDGIIAFFLVLDSSDCLLLLNFADSSCY